MIESPSYRSPYLDTAAHPAPIGSTCVVSDSDIVPMTGITFFNNTGTNNREAIARRALIALEKLLADHKDRLVTDEQAHYTAALLGDVVRPFITFDGIKMLDSVIESYAQILRDKQPNPEPPEVKVEDPLGDIDDAW
jgi:hypothetical protein